MVDSGYLQNPPPSRRRRWRTTRAFPRPQAPAAAAAAVAGVLHVLGKMRCQGTAGGEPRNTRPHTRAVGSWRPAVCVGAALHAGRRPAGEIALSGNPTGLFFGCMA